MKQNKKLVRYKLLPREVLLISQVVPFLLLFIPLFLSFLPSCHYTFYMRFQIPSLPPFNSIFINCSNERKSILYQTVQFIVHSEKLIMHRK